MLSPSCLTLNLEERIKIGLALQKLQQTTDCDEILFWGKIRGYFS